MPRRIFKTAVIFASVLTVSAAVPARSEAGIIPWLYNAVFGPPGSLYGYNYYYPSYGYPAYRQPYYYYPSSYSPAYYYPAPSSCGSCCTSSPRSCVPACSSCEMPTCTQTSGKLNEVSPATPQPDDQLNDEGFRTPKIGEPKPSFPDDDLKGNTTGKPEGTNGVSDPASSNGTNLDPETNRRPVQLEQRGQRLATLRFDDSITWQAPPPHTRLTLRSNYVRPRVVRRRIVPSQDWVIVPDAPQLAQRAN